MQFWCFIINFIIFQLKRQLKFVIGQLNVVHFHCDINFGGTRGGCTRSLLVYVYTVEIVQRPHNSLQRYPLDQYISTQAVQKLFYTSYTLDGCDAYARCGQLPMLAMHGILIVHNLFCGRHRKISTDALCRCIFRYLAAYVSLLTLKESFLVSFNIRKWS